MLSSRPIPILGNKNMGRPTLSRIIAAKRPISIGITAGHGDVSHIGITAKHYPGCESEFLIHVLITKKRQPWPTLETASRDCRNVSEIIGAPRSWLPGPNKRYFVFTFKSYFLRNRFKRDLCASTNAMKP